MQILLFLQEFYAFMAKEGGGKVEESKIKWYGRDFCSANTEYSPH